METKEEYIATFIFASITYFGQERQSLDSGNKKILLEMLLVAGQNSVLNKLMESYFSPSQAFVLISVCCLNEKLMETFKNCILNLQKNKESHLEPFYIAASQLSSYETELLGNIFKVLPLKIFYFCRIAI